MSLCRIRRTSLVMVLLATSALAQPEAQAPAEDVGLPAEVDVKDLDLEAMLSQVVVSSTKSEQRGSEAPAVVTVITAEEIQARGYTTLAEVLRAVPGLYAVNDFANHNFGVRGVNGGARASGNVIKLMIDGHPVDYRPSTGNFFGEELIPLHLVERVEILRGPASALYGANAFLGVINVLTRTSKSLGNFELLAQGRLTNGNPGGGGGFTLSAGGEGFDLVVGGQLSYVDWSGLALPASSPVLSTSAGAGIAGRGPSARDISRPKTLFGKLTVPLGAGKVTAWSSIQNQDTSGEFQDFGPLTHSTRLAVINQNHRLSYDVKLGERVSLQASGYYFAATPSPEEQLDIGRPDYLLRRRGGMQGWGVTAEGRVQVHEQVNVTVGADLVSEAHLLQTFDQQLKANVLSSDGTVIRPAGTLTPGEGSGRTQAFLNVGAFAQALVNFGPDWKAIAGGRVDLHNIYGTNPSARVGVVYAPREKPFSFKVLYGSAFKAPSAVQLYTQPMKLLDLEGNPGLRPQTAHTFEVAGGLAVAERLELTANVFATAVLGRVEFIQRGLSLQATNLLDDWIVGGELESRVKLARGLHLKAGAGVARTVAHSAGTLPAGTPDVPNALFPLYQVHLSGDYLLPFGGLRFSAELSWVGARSASQSSALINGAAYEVPGYLYSALALAMPRRVLFGKTETSAALRVTNVLNWRWVEPGFGGIDVPAAPVAASLTLMQSF